MENKEQQILSEIKDMMNSIRRQLELLDSKMAELQHEFDPEASRINLSDIDLDIDTETITDTEDIPVSVDVMEGSIPEDLISADTETEEEHALTEEPEEDTEEDPAEDITEKEEESEDVIVMEEEEEELLLAPAEEPAIRLETHASAPKVAVIDLMTSRQAWRNDMPGTPVKDIRSAIALNDRILFIKMLFNEDPIEFQNAISAINSMETLDEVLEFIAAGHPDWDMDSDVVYRFMMAIRRRVK